MKNLYKTLILLAVITLFTACGGKGGTKEGAAPDDSTDIEVVLCDGTAPLDECAIGNRPFTCVKNGDSLVIQSTNTKIEVIHDSNDNKKVCVNKIDNAINIAASAKLTRINP